MEIARLQIAVDALQARVAQVELDKLNKSAGRAETGTNKLSGSADKLGIALAGMVTAGTLMSIQRLSEEFVLMQARVGRLSESADEATVTYGHLSEIARTTGASLGDTVKLWEALNFTLKDLGGNNDQVIRFTETLQKIGAIGGNSAEEMSNALRQLGQALAGGVVRGEEFNSIIESMPALLREIAQGMGVPFGELRQIMLDGGLTAETVLAALQDRGMAVDREFAKIPRTVSQAAESLRTDLGNAIAELDRTIGASSGFAQLIDLLSKGIRFTAGDFTDLERLNQLTAERASVQQSLEMAQRRTILSAQEQAAYDQRLANINAQIVEIQDRRVKQIQQEGAEISGNSQKAADARQQTLAGLEEERKLAAMTAKERAQYKAEQLLGVGATEQEIAKARELAAQTFELANSHKSVVSQIKVRATEADRMAKAEAAAAEANARTIADLAEQLYQAGLGASELAQRQAELRLNQYATPEQIASVRQLSAELQRMQEIEDRKKAFGSDPASTIRGNVTPLSGGVFDDQMGRYDAEREAENLRYAEQQARLQEAQQLKLLSTQEFYALEQQMAQENASRIAQIEQARLGMMLSTGEQGFSALADLTKQFAGEQSSAYKAMFIASKAFAIAQSMVAIQSGIAQAAANPWPINLAAMASVAAATAGLVSNISAVAMPSFDGGGFTGTGSRSGGMDGKGGFMAMLHPNETVIDHTKGQSAGGSSTTNVINITVDTGGTTTESGQAQSDSVALAQSIRTVVVDEMERQNRQGGILWSMRNG